MKKRLLISRAFTLCLVGVMFVANADNKVRENEGVPKPHTKEHRFVGPNRFSYAGIDWRNRFEKEKRLAIDRYKDPKKDR